MVYKLLRIRLLMFRNGLLRGDVKDRRRMRSGLVFSVVILISVGTMAYDFFDPFMELASSNHSMRVVLEAMPAFAFFSAFWMLLLSAISVAISVFYMDNEMPLLLAAPVPARAVFCARFVQATVTNATLFITVGAPVLLAYGLAHGYITPPYIVYLALVMVAFAALPTGIGTLLALLLMRVLRPSRMREILGALGMALFALGYLALSLGVRQVSDAATLRGGMAGIARVVTSPLFMHGPWAWAGSVLNGRLDTAHAWLAIGWLVALAAVTIYVTASVAELVHWRGWTSLQEMPRSPKTSRHGGTSWESRLPFLWPPVRAVVLKDLRTLRRDIRQLSLFFIPVALVVVFLWNIDQTPQVQRLPSPLLALTLCPVLAMISLRLAMSGFVAENRALWLMLTAPNDPRAILWGKFVYAFLLSLPVSIVTTAAYSVVGCAQPGEAIANMGLILCATAGFCGIGVGASVMFCDFRADDPRYTLTGAARLVTFAFQMAFLIVLLCVAVAAWFVEVQRIVPTAVVYGAACMLVIPASAIFTAVPMALGARRLRAMEW